MNTRHRFGLAAGFVALSGVASLVAAPDLPSQLVASWDTSGDPNGTISRTLGLSLLPALTAGLLVVFALLPRIDPLRENVAEFRTYFDWFVVVFAAYSFVLHAGILAFNLGYEFDFLVLVLVGAAGLFYYCGVLLTHAERNWFVGIRTPWTLSNEEVWNRTHALGGTLFKATAISTLLGLPFGDTAVYFLLAPLLLTAATTAVYSYYLYERIERREETAADAEV